MGWGLTFFADPGWGGGTFYQTSGFFFLQLNISRYIDYCICKLAVFQYILEGGLMFFMVMGGVNFYMAVNFYFSALLT